MERTFAIIKPDAVASGKAGQILARIEAAGFSVRAMRLDALFADAELGAGAPFFEGVQDILHAASARLLVPI